LLTIADESSWVSPAQFALWTSGGRWLPASHLELLDQALVEALDAAAAGRLDGLAVSMPPQHGKSELCSKFLPAWFLGTHPDQRVILVGYEADFAASWGRKARVVLEEYGYLFGVAVSPCSSAARRWDIAGREGGMSAAGVGGPITGKGAHLLIIDDPIKNDEEARSASFRQKQWEWWQSVASTRLRPGGLVVLIQTRWHRDDLTGRILDQAAAAGRPWRQIRLTAIAEENDPLGRAPGEALWPEMYPLEKLEAIRATHTNYCWRAMYQQAPVTDGSTEWPDTYFGPGIWFEEWPATWRCRTVALDPSKGSDAKFGDYSAFVKLLVDAEGRYYVDADLARMNTQALVEQAVEIQRTFVPDGFAVEVNQFQQLLADELDRFAHSRRVWIPLVPIDNHVNKFVRIRRLTSLLAKGQIRFKARSIGAKLLVEQLREFPHGDHDDGPDALEMAVRVASDLMAAPDDKGPGWTTERAIAM
jgi:predicted phage terminase large subunit-like protein